MERAKEPRHGFRPSTACLGAAAEDLACRHLVSKGYRIIARNVRLGPGEIDAVARLGRLIVFVEVKSGGAGPGQLARAAESVTAHKRLRLRAAAARYLAACGLPPDAECRFDVLLVLTSQTAGEAGFLLLEDAF